MKRILLSIHLLLFTVVAQSNPISLREAKSKALAFFQQQGVTMSETSRPYQAPLQKEQQTCSYYVFNADNNMGFVLISGDDRTPEILGYSNQGSFDYDKAPDNMKAWLDEYARQITWLQTQSSNSSNVRQSEPSKERRSAKISKKNSIDPLLTTQWNQRSPYYDQCPVINSKNALTGCVATAMAQLLYYHNKDNGTTYTTAEIPGYVSTTHNISMPAIKANTPINWNVLQDTYVKGQYTNESGSEIAKLMLMCGTALEMDYDPNASSASIGNIPNILNDYFGIENDLQCVYRANQSEECWDSVIYNELSHSQPVVYSGSTWDLNSSHAFIVDGFEESTEMFHINWGWGGHWDGYYLLSVLTPNENGDVYSGYNYNQFAILTIEKDDFYEYYQNENGFEVSLTEGFRHALNNNISYASWEYGTALPAPLSTIVGLKESSYRYLFVNCKADQLDLSNFNTENVTDMCEMFLGCDSLKSLDLSHFNTDKVTDMSWMFYSCDLLEKLDLSGFELTNVTNKENMFSFTSYRVNGTAVGYAKDEETIALLETGTGIDTKKLKFVIGEKPNAIIPLFSDKPNKPIYNLNGQRLTKMQRGINVVGGAKYLVK